MVSMILRNIVVVRLATLPHAVVPAAAFEGVL
jgi:hypothetical protein